MTGYQVFPAPYITDPERLVCHASHWPQAAFVRLCDPATPDRVTDIFHAGHTRAWTQYYDTNAPGQWLRKSLQMLRFENEAPLVGCFAYEYGFQFEPDRWTDLPCVHGQPMFLFHEMNVWYQADHASRTAGIYAIKGTPRDTIHVFMEFLRNAMDGRLETSRHCYSPGQAGAFMPFGPRELSDLGELTRQEYLADVDNIIEDIRAGRYYELNFTQRFYKKSAVPPHVIFTRLMQKLKPAYAFYGHFQGEVVVSASPELFLHKHGSVIQTCPIKGSYRQAPSPAEASKLHAEHTMVVDLARNDLGRISDCGWVQVAEQAAARQFGQITHLESRITGKTSHGINDILAATLPAASITGTPKVISVQSIARHEHSPRGIYTGNCGILWPNGDLQLNVAIRTLHAVPSYQESGSSADNQWNYTLGAGGAIVADSNPEQEYQECLMKATPLLEELTGRKMGDSD